MFYTTDKDGNIIAAADFKFSEQALETDKEILRGFDGKLYFEDELPEKSITILKEEKLFEINNAYDLAVSSLVNTYPQTEILTFDKQESEAKVWKLDNSVETPLIDMLVLGRGIEKSDLVERILKKAESFALSTGYLTGLRQRYEDMLMSATTKEEIAAITPEYTLGVKA